MPSQITPELSIVDYLLWALQRYILTDDNRYYLALINKYNLIIDLYDFKNFKRNYYNSKNCFEKPRQIISGLMDIFKNKSNLLYLVPILVTPASAGCRI